MCKGTAENISVPRTLELRSGESVSCRVQALSCIRYSLAQPHSSPGNAAFHSSEHPVYNIGYFLPYFVRFDTICIYETLTLVMRMFLRIVIVYIDELTT